ncbi:hypothetical protein LTR84_009838 [Exophiala bonariae]|uniref:Btz domain-containing protein n=1 Tax=Exophiala bonariae TaxID=1690606 RepID=A0AAV9NN23_9EURO|nr:hypothetical protein LTR84_009838 [Exophiala bonariae]
MYALRTTDIPPPRHGGRKGGEHGEIPTGSTALDINFEESKLDPSLHRFTSKHSRSDDQNPSTISGLQMPAGIVPNTDPPKQPNSGRQQRKRLAKRTAKFFHKQTCDDLSRAVRDPDQHHKHFTEDFPKPQKRNAATDTSFRGGEVVGPEVDKSHYLSTTPTGGTRKSPRINSKSPVALQDSDLPDCEDVGDRPTSRLKRGLARVKSMSAILVNTGRVPQFDTVSTSGDKNSKRETGLTSLGASEIPDTRSESVEPRNTQAAEHAAFKQGAESAKTTLSQLPPTVGFLTNEAMQHDRVRFANAFRSRIEARRQRELEKATSAASLARIRGGWGGRDRGLDVPDWVREMDHEMRRMRDDPHFQPFRRVREHRGDDGSYHYQEHFDYDSRRDGPIGRTGRDAGRLGARHGGGLGGRTRVLLGGGRPRSPPGGDESDSEDDLPRGPPLQGPPGMGGQGMREFGGMPPGMGPMGIGGPGGMGQLGMGGFGRVPPGMGPPGRAGFIRMGGPHMGGLGGMPVGVIGPMGMGPRAMGGMGGMGGFGGMPAIIGIPVMGGRGMFPCGGHVGGEIEGPADGPPGLDQDGDDGDDSDEGEDPEDDPDARYDYRLDGNRRRW